MSFSHKHDPFSRQKIMVSIGIVHAKRRKPNIIAKAERNARKSDNRIQRHFYADKACTKCVTDIAEIKAKSIKSHVSGIFDCYDASVPGLAMGTHSVFFADKAQEYKRHHHVAFFEERPGIARCPQDASSLKENSVEIDCFFCFLFLAIFGFFGCLTESEVCDFDCDALRGGIGFLDLIIAASAGDEAMDDLGKFVLFRRVFGVDFEG